MSIFNIQKYTSWNGYYASVIQSSVNSFLTRFGEWLAEILRHSEFLGWAAEYFESGSINLAGIFLHNSVNYNPFDIGAERLQRSPPPSPNDHRAKGVLTTSGWSTCSLAQSGPPFSNNQKILNPRKAELGSLPKPLCVMNDLSLYV